MREEPSGCFNSLVELSMSLLILLFLGCICIKIHQLDSEINDLQNQNAYQHVMIEQLLGDNR